MSAPTPSELVTKNFPVGSDKLLILGEQPLSNPGEGVTADRLLTLTPQVIVFRDALDTVTAAPHLLTGEYREIANTLSADYTTDFALANQHLYIDVITVTTGGDIVITGCSLSEGSGVPVDDDTETITITDDDATCYQSDKKWLEITNIDVETGAIDTIDYDIGIVGYLDFGNRDFRVTGFRAEFESNNTGADIQLRIRKVQDNGSGQMELVLMESIGIDSTGGNGVIDDNKRTAADDRSFTFGATAWANGGMAVLKTTDYETFFVADENILESSTKAEGIIIDYLGSPSGNINNVAHCTLTLFFKFD